jgi:hypothetical protein
MLDRIILYESEIGIFELLFHDININNALSLCAIYSLKGNGNNKIGILNFMWTASSEPNKTNFYCHLKIPYLNHNSFSAKESDLKIIDYLNHGYSNYIERRILYKDISRILEIPFIEDRIVEWILFFVAGFDTMKEQYIRDYYNYLKSK